MSGSAGVPRSVRLGYRPVRVELSASLPSDEDGHCDTARHAAVVRAQLDEPDRAVTLLHELMHHMIHRAGGACALGLDADTEERVVSLLSAGVAELAQRNPKAAGWFVRSVGGTGTPG